MLLFSSNRIGPEIFQKLLEIESKVNIQEVNWRNSDKQTNDAIFEESRSLNIPPNTVYFKLLAERYQALVFVSINADVDADYEVRLLPNEEDKLKMTSLKHKIHTICKF